jgi:hypothetical protein
VPNGRSGGFIISKADLKQLLDALSDSAAKVIAHPPPSDPADVLEMVRRVGECPNDHIAVEEQHHASYVIHLTNEPEPIWVSVLPDTPLFQELRQRHKQWELEHPNWTGWVAF